MFGRVFFPRRFDVKFVVAAAVIDGLFSYCFCCVFVFLIHISKFCLNRKQYEMVLIHNWTYITADYILSMMLAASWRLSWQLLTDNCLLKTVY